MLKMSFMLLFILIGCGKAPETANAPSSKEALEGKTDEEVFVIKYQAPFILDCALRTAEGNIIKSGLIPEDQFEWSLNEDLSIMRLLHYQIGDQKMIIVVKIVEAPKIQPYVNHISENRKEYFMENSPVLKIKYRRAPGRILYDGSVHNPIAYKEVTLYENVENRIFSIASEVKNGLMTDDFRCTLKTKIHPFFRDQWKEIR